MPNGAYYTSLHSIGGENYYMPNKVTGDYSHISSFTVASDNAYTASLQFIPHWSRKKNNNNNNNNNKMEK